MPVLEILVERKHNHQILFLECQPAPPQIRIAEGDDEEIEKSNKEGDKVILKRSTDNSDMKNRTEGNEQCIICGKGEDDDHEVETWVLCDQCNNWIPCVPLDHI